MIEPISTTPFGRRSLTFAMLAGQMASESCEPGASVNKWQVFRAVCEAKTKLGASDRALGVLNALLSFHPDTDLVEGEGLVVFPSNAQLSLRAHGMAPATLRRHLAVLVECGLVVRRDSPNGKRYARKDQSGDIRQAFGFDLTPLLARAREFEAMAETVRGERRALQLLKERITILRRDISKMLSFGLEEGILTDWQGYRLAYQEVVSQMPRTASRMELEPIAQALAQLAQSVRKVLENHVKTQNPSANESHSERHIQNPETESHGIEARAQKAPKRHTRPTPETRNRPSRGYPLELVLRACPDIVHYARNGVSDWGALVDAANLVRGALGISLDAWQQACATMGPADAAISVATILQRTEQINNPGGYLRSLTGKARAGRFSAGPMLMALLRTADRGQRAKTG
jgi:replication initiation protein RepC